MIIWVAAALIVGFIIGAIEGRASVEKARQIAAEADTEAQAIKDVTANAIAHLDASVAGDLHEAAQTWASVVSTLRAAL